MAGVRTLNKSLIDIIEESSSKFADSCCMRRFDGEKFVDIGFHEFAERVFRIGRGLLSIGFQPGERIAILSENRPEWGAAYLGTLAAGCVNVPLDALLKMSGWSHILRESGARALVVSKSILPEFEQILGEIPDLQFLICMDKPSSGSNAISLAELEEKGSRSNETLFRPEPSDLAAILYTSGTTGQSKGVMLTHGNITSDIDGMLQMIDAGPGDNFLSVLPIHHTLECTCGFLTPIAAGCSITYARGLASKLIVEDISNTGVTILIGVPLLFEKMHAGIMKAVSKKPARTRVVFKALYGLSGLALNLLGVEAGTTVFRSMREKAGLSSLRLMVTGGAPMPSDVAKAFNILGFTFIQGYGLTESSPVLTVNPMDNRKDSSIGIPLPGAELRIIDRDSRGVGEIIARGPMVMSGYYKNKEATEEVLKDGWLHTGDSGWVDDDGYFYIAGRLKNVIVTPAGKNVYPEEIEAVLNTSPFILESLVLGRPLGGGRGEEIEAVIVPDYEYFDALAAERGEGFSSEEIEKTVKKEVAECCSGLADFKRVKYVQVREEEFEKTSTRKIKRYLFRQKSEPVMQSREKGLE